MPVPTPPTAIDLSGLTVATIVNPTDIMLVEHMGVDLQVPYSLLQFLINGALVYANSAVTISGTVFGYMGDGSAGTFAITLPAISGWPGGDITFVNVGPSGTFTIAAAGSDNIIIKGSAVSSITSPLAGYPAISLRPMAPGGTGVAGWYVIDSGAPITGSTSITTLGTIATGTWQATPIVVAYLGSGTPSAGKYLDGGGTWTTLTSGPPSGTAGGSLAGTYPNPTLASTAVPIGSYTNANITVQADGRLTAASNGTAGVTGSGTTGKAATWASSSTLGNPSAIVGAPTLALTTFGLLTVGTPTIAAGAGLGTSPSVSITGNDQRGYITFTVGTIPTANATVCTVTFGSTWANAPFVLISSGSNNVMGLDIASPPSGWATTGFTITVGTVVLAAGTYIIPYACF